MDALAANIREKYWLPIESDYQRGAWTELDARYREKHRAYHTWEHINEIFDRLKEFSNLATRRDIIVAAIFWHDAIYDLHDDDGSLRADRDNVRASAALFRRYVSLDEDDADAVQELIMGTADHLHAKPSQERYPGFSDDFDLFLDMDLGSLASPWKQFEANLDKIRFENSMTSEAEFCRSQIALLTSFNDQAPTLFRRKETREKWSHDAVANLRRCIQELHYRLKIAQIGDSNADHEAP